MISLTEGLFFFSWILAVNHVDNHSFSICGKIFNKVASLVDEGLLNFHSFCVN